VDHGSNIAQGDGDVNNEHDTTNMTNATNMN